MTPAMRAWLRRLARSPHRDALVLRGSALTSAWCPGRGAPEDLDFVQLPAFAYETDVARLLAVSSLALDDDLGFDVDAAHRELIWAETTTPGARVVIPYGAERLRIDVAPGDPIDPLPIEVCLEGVGAPLRAVRPETMLAWKAHGLVEFGRGRWRPKDLVDAWLLLRHTPLVRDDLARALEIAFASRTTLPSMARDLLYDDAWGTSRSSRRIWARWHAEAPRACGVADLALVRDEVRAALRPYFAALGVTAASR